MVEHGNSFGALFRVGYQALFDEVTNYFVLESLVLRIRWQLVDNVVVAVACIAVREGQRTT